MNEDFVLNPPSTLSGRVGIHSAKPPRVCSPCPTGRCKAPGAMASPTPCVPRHTRALGFRVGTWSWRAGQVQVGRPAAEGHLGGWVGISSLGDTLE